ncbi:RsfA family transcriptional regulator [Lentibacillus amyloliquefaciens]|uniref:Transcriptional regulator n=1 Tax=Lentibacillus amyloliquefaciens TaxID=1472767 RepID=A0A0U4F4W5_9BACI|nr:RsfA family transcriptional regulator [Lentibacillus amyloliquefaciens]ALX50551.1 transcriptional regulator [Lentibacillus amyloliquefaciens]
MAKVRQDAWSHEDDLLLAETVLRHIREGSTQLHAFEEVGDKLNRTSAACGFRWNAEVRNTYNDAIELAKRQRKDKKRADAKKARQPVAAIQENKNQHADKGSVDTVYDDTAQSITIDSVIQFLKQLDKDYQASNQSKQSLEQMGQENETLKKQVNQLENKLKQTAKQLETVQEDYQVFMQIMDRARKMTVFDDKDSVQAPSFQMDKNGNLQQVADGPSNQ